MYGINTHSLVLEHQEHSVDSYLYFIGIKLKRTDVQGT